MNCDGVHFRKAASAALLKMHTFTGDILMIWDILNFKNTFGSVLCIPEQINIKNIRRQF